MPDGTADQVGLAGPGTPVLQARDISMRFGGVTALTDVSIHIRREEVLGIIGPNGAGKTTLVNILSGFQRPTRGKVELDGVDITRWPAHRRARHGLARTFQAVRLFAPLTVVQNLQAAAIAAGHSVHAAEQHAYRMTERFGLCNYADAVASGLPHGVERRVGILRALAAQPKVLLLDEPAAGLNERESDELGEALHAIRADHGCAIAIIEHDMRLVMSRCDRIHVLAAGTTLASGSPDEVRRHEEVIEAYLGGA